MLGEEENLVGMEGGRDLFLIMTDRESRYCLYRIRDPQVLGSTSGDEASVRNLGEPLLRMDKSTFPNVMNFVAMGSRIYMVGGFSMDDNNQSCNSNKVFIYDTSSSESKCIMGPTMNSGKLQPRLFTLGSKLFALSYLLYPADREDSYLDHPPRFEMLDTDDLESSWSALPVPIFSKVMKSHAVVAFAAVYIDGSSHCGGVIFISVGESGTYAFDVDKRVWKFVNDDILPFSGHALLIPHEPSLCCAHSLKSNRFSAFRFWYGDDEINHGFRVDEIVIEDSYRLSPLWPRLVCNRPMRTTFGPDGRGYFIMTGVDKPPSYASSGGNRYVKVYALKFSNTKLIQDKTSKGQWLKRCKSKKRQMEHDEVHDETPGVKGTLKRCKKKKKTSHMGHEVEEETTELKLTNLWEMCFNGGPVCDELIHVAGAFAM